MSATLPDGAASSSTSAGQCNHKYCSGCMKQYVGSHLQARKVPICCPQLACEGELSNDNVQQLLADDVNALQLYHLLEAECLIDTARRVYCPHNDCSEMLERPEQADELGGNHQQCPMCHRSFCLSCGIAGWHAGLTCQQFQALPPELRSAEDAAVHHIARSKLWKRCPARGCGHMVERSEGCNHMHCICGCSFCYGCGAPYTDTQPTPDNVHGTPGCTCALFNVPAEEEQLQLQLQPQQQHIDDDGLILVDADPEAAAGDVVVFDAASDDLEDVYPEVAAAAAEPDGLEDVYPEVAAAEPDGLDVLVLLEPDSPRCVYYLEG